MTAKQMVKALEKIVAKHGNVEVGVDWQALRDKSNGVYDIANVGGDGFHVENKDGTERRKRCAVVK